MVRTTALLVGLIVGFVSVLVPTNASTAWKELESRPDAPGFTLYDLRGQRYRLKEFKGKIVLINFWATWCPPCRAEMPSLQRAWEKLKGDDFAVLAIAVNEDPYAITKFMMTTSPSLTFTVLLDQHMDASRYWPLKGLPASFILDRRGRVMYVMHGALEWDNPEIVNRIRSLVEETDGGASD